MSNRKTQSPTYYNVGKIVAPHGIRGEVRVLEKTDFPDQRFASGKKLYLFPPSREEPITVTVEKSRRHKNVRLVKFAEYHSINEVESFRNAQLAITAADREAAEKSEDEYYYDEVIGCLVVTDEGKELGIVDHIYSLPANDVWVVRSPDQGEILLPFIEDVVKEVNVAEKRIVIHWMEGLA